MNRQCRAWEVIAETEPTLENAWESPVSKIHSLRDVMRGLGRRNQVNLYS